jgi:chromosome partitioning protein
MEGLSQIMTCRQTKAENHRLEIGGIVLTMYDPSLGWLTSCGRGPTVFR